MHRLIMCLLLHCVAGGLPPQEIIAGKTWGNNCVAYEKNDETSIKVLYELGLQRGDTAIAFWENLLNQAVNNSEHLYQCKILLKEGCIYFARGNLSHASVLFKQALTIAEQQDYQAEKISIIKKLEITYTAQFNREQALLFIYKGINAAETINDRENLAYFYGKLGNYYSGLNDFSKAIGNHFKSLKTYEDLKLESGIASALMDIGSTYEMMKQYENALYYYLRIRVYVAKLKGAMQFQAYCSIAQAYRMLHRYDSAYSYSNQASRLVGIMNNKYAQASFLCTQALIDLDAGNLPACEKNALHSLQICKEIQFTAQLPSLYILLKTFYRRKGDYRKALAMYEAEITLRDSLSGEQVRKEALQKQFNYDLEKKETANKFLMQENTIQDLQLRQSKYFITGFIVLAFIVLLGIVFFVRQRKLKTDHQRIALEQRLLRSQMNPHFIFNSLNSIQQMIMTADNDKAEIYLGKFSKLIRDLLESNGSESLTLTEEISILNAYLEMESLRFGNTFTYTIDMASIPNPDNIRIPLLMVQPFVENAIWHGLLPKEGERLLRIFFSPHKSRTIICEVDDNGVGRDTSAFKSFGLRKKSLALGFVKQRMDLIRKTHRIEGGTKIIDKKNAADNSTGTTVRIIIPVLNS